MQPFESERLFSGREALDYSHITKKKKLVADSWERLRYRSFSRGRDLPGINICMAAGGLGLLGIALATVLAIASWCSEKRRKYPADFQSRGDNRLLGHQAREYVDTILYWAAQVPARRPLAISAEAVVPKRLGAPSLLGTTELARIFRVGGKALEAVTKASRANGFRDACRRKGAFRSDRGLRHRSIHFARHPSRRAFHRLRL